MTDLARKPGLYRRTCTKRQMKDILHELNVLNAVPNNTEAVTRYMERNVVRSHFLVSFPDNAYEGISVILREEPGLTIFIDTAERMIYSELDYQRADEIELSAGIVEILLAWGAAKWQQKSQKQAVKMGHNAGADGQTAIEGV